jgi:hypothetical protein
MLHKFSASMLLTIFLTANCALSADALTFAQWISACSLLSDSTAKTVNTGECIGYTQGVLDTARLAEPESEALFCDKRGALVVRDYVEIGQKWAAENAAGLQTSAAFQLMQAFKFYLPCDETVDSL